MIDPQDLPKARTNEVDPNQTGQADNRSHSESDCENEISVHGASQIKMLKNENKSLKIELQAAHAEIDCLKKNHALEMSTMQGKVSNFEQLLAEKQHLLT